MLVLLLALQAETVLSGNGAQQKQCSAETVYTTLPQQVYAQQLFKHGHKAGLKVHIRVRLTYQRSRQRPVGSPCTGL